MDLALVEAARSGDEEAFASIVRGSADRLFVVAHRILRDVGRAEDAVQQTLVTAWRELPALRETERFEAWLHRILVHACYAEAKRASQMVRQRRGAARRRAGDAGHHPGHRHARCARSWVPSVADGATRGVRPPPLPRLVGRRDRRDPRRPDGNDQVEDPLRDIHPPGGTRCRCPDDQHHFPGADGMNENDFDLAARAWLDDGPNRMSDHAVLSTLEEIHTTRQRRVLRPAWRATPVSIFARMATAAVLVVAVGFLAITVVPRLRTDRASAARHRRRRRPAADFPALTTTFVSPRNGFSVKHPERVTITPATNVWRLGDDGVRCHRDRPGRRLQGRVDGDPGESSRPTSGSTGSSRTRLRMRCLGSSRHRSTSTACRAGSRSVRT